ncbi:MAG TPA: SGNH/GDSL hydrolase family protein [Dehalococcoidia bacterium]|jgi:lysophospholipase L1-like esterase
MQTRLIALILAAAGAVMLLTPVHAADPAVAGYPNSIAALGDSITRAFDTCSTVLTDCPANSWSTGTNSAVNSHYQRILANNSAISGRNYNDAQTGAKMADLNAQVQAAIAQHAEYVTILIGANDVCTSSESTMTPVSTFRAEFQTAMNTLTAGLPDARIYVVSIPNVWQLWNIEHNNIWAQFVWTVAGICQSMLANPTSTAQADVDRRARVAWQSIVYDWQLGDVCAAYVHCRFDNWAAFSINFPPSDVSSIDSFHPSISGQALAASISWAASFDFTDRTPPVSVATRTAVSGGTSVALAATDNAGVSGIEYKIGSGSYTKYSAPEFVPIGTVLTYRAVDVNGNSEASHSITG